MHPVGSTIPALISVQARKAPHSLAVVDDELSLTYAELEERSDALAAYLRTKGLGRDTVIGVCIRRSAAQIVGALAVMKAGAAYLPLDPDQPRERLIFALGDARTDVVLVADHVPAAGKLDGLDTIRLGIDGSFACDRPPVVDAANIEPADLAYVIYTSGSTGRPKGVEITHGGLANLVAWHLRAYEVDAADRASHISAIGFDAAVWEVWPYLSAGASVHIASDAVAREQRALAEWLNAKAITIAFVATPMAERLIDFEYPPGMALRAMLTGADTLHRYAPLSLPFALYNNYGPTEATVVATSGRVEWAADDGGLPSIGRPIDNVEIFLLDENGVPRERGAEGEICIAGAGLAKGYRGRPDLTAEKFVWVTFGAGPPVRIYRTGDRGRQLADGRIAYLGRLDDQVKIRGFRVEPGEIEGAIDAYEGVLESAVVVREFGPGDDRLIAYLVPRDGHALALGDLQGFLAARLPAYMLPATFVELPALPLTSNGKVDRADLRAREVPSGPSAESYIAPRTPTEERVAHVVQGLLRLDRVSVDGDFFKLGGHSLLGTQLIARLRDAFGVRMSLRFLFESPTIAALSAEVERLVFERISKTGGDPEPAPVEAVGGSAARIPKRRL